MRTALANSTVNQPKGTLYGGQHAFSLLTNDQLMTASGFNDYILAYRNGAPVRVRDIGRAVVAAEDKTLAGWLGTHRAVLIQIQRQPGANVIETVDQIKKVLPQLQASLPPSIKVEIVSDRTQTIRASVADVKFTLLLTIATGRQRHLPVPAKALGHGDPGGLGAAVADRYLRRDLPLWLQPRQSLA